MAASGNGLAKRREQQAQFVRFAGTRQLKMSTISSRFEASVIRSGQIGITFNQSVNDATLEKQECSRYGKAFHRKTGAGRPAKYCSRFCGLVAKGKLNDVNRGKQQCCACSREFSAERKKKYCSVKCRSIQPPKKHHEGTCAYCGVAFASERKNIYCSIDCCGKDKKRKASERSTKQCPVCDKVFVPKYKLWGKTCGRLCAASLRLKEGKYRHQTLQAKMSAMIRAAQIQVQRYCKRRLRDCAQCGGTMLGESLHKNRCAKCRAILSDGAIRYFRQVVKQYLIRGNKPCRKCGRTAMFWHGHCEGCTKKVNRDRARSTKSHRKRCRKHGSEYDPSLRLQHVVDRDGIECHWCGVETVESNTYRKDQRTLDHVLPISKGGGHILSNVVVACNECNTKKSNRRLTLF